jgi:hypothetical protein
MSSSKSTASSATTSSTSTVSDSYNQTLNRVSNLSDVGNVKLDFSAGDNPVSGGNASYTPLIAIGVAIAVFAAVKIFKK